MSLAENQLKELDNPALTRNERVLLRCRLASEFIHLGQYASAQEALGDLWQGVGHRPDIESLKPLTAAEVLLQCGALSGWLGSLQTISGAQGKATDLIFEALRIFQAQHQHARIAEALYELSLCHFRLGAVEEAYLMLERALQGLGDTDHEPTHDLTANILLRRAEFDRWRGRLHDALQLLEQAGEFLASCGESLKGRWHSLLAQVLMKLALTEQRADYTERAISEYRTSSSHFEQAGHDRESGHNFTRLAFLLYKLGRYTEAHQALDRAQAIGERRAEAGTGGEADEAGELARVQQTRAQVLLAEGHSHEANHLISGVIQGLEKGSHSALLAAALTLQGIIHARLGLHESSIQILRDAISVGHTSGDSAEAGRAALALLEEHGRERLSAREVIDLYHRADELLQDIRDAEEITRLRGCARIVTAKAVGVRLSDPDFVLPEVVQAYEAEFIREALEAEGGVVTRAASRLGIYHQTLILMLQGRHQELLGLRTPARRRRGHLMRHDTSGKKGKRQDE
jgi:tetratricopeptide (TPR) repeat protein